MHQIGACIFGDHASTGNRKTSFSSVDGVIHNPHLFGAGFLAELYHRLQHLGVGRGRQMRCPRPGNVGFDGHHIPFGNKTPHAPRGFEGFPGQGFDGVAFRPAHAVNQKFR